MTSSPPFLFVTCQVGAERAVKTELAIHWPAFRFAYSRPGFLTFKLPPEHAPAEDFELQSVFARAYGFSLGSAADEDLDRVAHEAWSVAGERAYDRLHVWPRDAVAAGHRGYEPGPTPESIEAEQTLRRLAATPRTDPPDDVTRPGELALDCVLVEPRQWWIGYHRAASIPSCWPGGFFPAPLPAEAVSRAYLKMEEALTWSRLPIKAGERCVEIGCAPGGASQSLLQHGLSVMGIDPADVDPRVTAHPQFVHVKKRGADVRRREFRKIRWLTADMNVAPTYTLDTVEAIVTHHEVDVRGMLLTLKLPDWNLAAELQQWLARIRSWGYTDVDARQLHHNRQELCVAARRE
jgi:23S rRNA (cytidine2498-2'-O)-methyltransferase